MQCKLLTNRAAHAQGMRTAGLVHFCTVGTFQKQVIVLHVPCARELAAERVWQRSETIASGSNHFRSESLRNPSCRNTCSRSA